MVKEYELARTLFTHKANPNLQDSTTGNTLLIDIAVAKNNEALANLINFYNGSLMDFSILFLNEKLTT